MLKTFLMSYNIVTIKFFEKQTKRLIKNTRPLKLNFCL